MLIRRVALDAEAISADPRSRRRRTHPATLIRSYQRGGHASLWFCGEII
jgi:hypothetical protein